MLRRKLMSMKLSEMEIFESFFNDCEDKQLGSSILKEDSVYSLFLSSF